MRVMGADLLASLMSQAAVLRSLHASVLAAGDEDTLAWRLGARAPPHAEQAVMTCLLFTHAHASSLADALAPVGGAEHTLGRPLSGPERAHLDDGTATSDALQTLLSAASAALARMRLGAGGPYLAAAATVIDILADVAAEVVQNEEARIKRFAHAAPERSWRSTMVQHAAAAGLTAPLAATAQ